MTMTIKPTHPRMIAKFNHITQYEGKSCNIHNITRRFTFNGNCIECSRFNARKYHNSPKGRASKLKRDFNMSLEKYNDLLKEQNYSCAACNKPQNTMNKKYGKKRLLSVDHNHITNKTRGLLCHNCNISLGLLHEDYNIISQLANYIKKYS